VCLLQVLPLTHIQAAILTCLNGVVNVSEAPQYTVDGVNVFLGERVNERHDYLPAK